MDTWSILKTIWFVIVFGSFFGYWVSVWIFDNMVLYIDQFNTEFFAKIPWEVLFLFTFLIFILIFVFILKIRE